jgi:hypothetical protein
MKRTAFVSVLAFGVAVVFAGSAFAQGKPTTSASQTQAKPTTGSPPPPAPAAPTKFVPPVKGTATVDFMQVRSKVVGKEVVTELKIKNTSSGAIHLLKVDELWYNKKRDMITNGTERYKKPFMPGEIITLEIKSPVIGSPAALDVDMFTFAHANGKVDAKKVKKLE